MSYNYGVNLEHLNPKRSYSSISNIPDCLEAEEQLPESEASLRRPVQCSTLQKKGFVMLKGRPCEIVEKFTSFTGKSGHDKIFIVGIDIFNGEKHEDCCPSTYVMDVPHIEREDYQLTDIRDGCLTSDNGEVRKVLGIPEGDLRDNIRAHLEGGKKLLCTVLKWGNEECITTVKIVD